MANDSALAHAVHLISVARKAMTIGNTSPATVNLKRYRAIAAATVDVVEKTKLIRVIRIFGRILSTKPKTDAERIAQMPQGFIPPTPETAVKARRVVDPIEFMRLTELQEEAANEIRVIYEQLTRSLQVKGLNLNMDRVDVSLVVRDPGEMMSDSLQERLVEYFLPWWRRHSKERIKRVRKLDIVFVVLFDMAPLWTIDRALGLSSGSSANIVRRALSDYWQGRVQR